MAGRFVNVAHFSYKPRSQ